MPYRIPRRHFLLQSGRAVLGASLLPIAGCSKSGLSTTDPEAQVPATLTNELEAQVPSLLAAARVPGLSIALVRNGQVAWARGFGVKNSSANAAVDANTLFEAGSVSKTVFAYAVMKLSEKRILDLDRPLTNYVSERWITDDPRFTQITARHVLSHTSGLQNWRSVKEPLRMHFDPGAKWLYSGEGYSYLQLVVAHLTGRVTQSCEKLFDGITVCATEIDAYLKTSLLRPFGMPTSGYVWERPSENTADAHGRDGNQSTDREQRRSWRRDTGRPAVS